MTDREPFLDEKRAEIDRLYNEMASEVDKWFYGLATQVADTIRENPTIIPWHRRIWWRICSKLNRYRERLALWIAPWLRKDDWDD
jgi:hypothetical protein